MNPTALNATNADYPVRLRERLGERAPSKLTVLGDLAILSERRSGLFCSVRCPGDAILGAYDSARRLRCHWWIPLPGGKGVPTDSAAGKTTHHYLLGASVREDSPTGRLAQRCGCRPLVLVSPFEKRPRRPTIESAQRRNEIVAALSDEVLIVHAESGGSVARISQMVEHWKVPKLNLPNNGSTSY